MSAQLKPPQAGVTGSSLRDLRVVVIGAGMSGVLMGIQLKRAGINDFTIIEKGDKIGGTWRDNNYPGLHCDVHSFAYCYSFDPNPEWSQMYAGGPEIREYFERMAVKYDIMPRIRFNAAVSEALWTGSKWRVSCDDGKIEMANIVISATGILHVPKYPDLPGLDTFRGACFHSARWNHNVPLDGKRIGVVGAGSTASQLTTALVDRAKSFTLFSRTPHWVANLMPNNYDPFSKESIEKLKRSPRRTKFYYDLTMLLWGVFTSGGVLRKSRIIRWLVERNVLQNLARVKDPELRKKLTPSYAIGCKRLVLSPNFYESIQQPKASYITERIERVVPEGVVTADGKLHELDVLALATGFDSSAFLGPIKMVGEGGHTIEQIWVDYPKAYHTLAVPHMPNFFMLQGPYSPAGNLPFTAVSEWQSEYILKCLDRIRCSEKPIALAPMQEATDTLMEKYRAEARNTVWSLQTGGCTSWYQGKDGVPIIYPFTSFQYKRELTTDPDFSEFNIQTLNQTEESR